MGYFAVILVILTAIIFIRGLIIRRREWKLPTGEFPPEWRTILMENVAYYNSLSKDDKAHFEYKIREFLLNCRITGIDTDIDDTDKLLVASSAIIPILRFKQWRYTNLVEVLIYPGAFDQNFRTDSDNNNILGMVGTGYMEGKMILSKPALRSGFKNSSDKKNTAIHEFVHLIDMSDGKTDGIPGVLLEQQYTIPWINLIERKIDEIYNDRSDINPYGGTNRTEFYAVASEYFFERPKLLKHKHPELYKLLTEIFEQDMAGRELNLRRLEIGRNSPCPCNSGRKFKHCCGKAHY